jgi:hypothetical protein
VKPQRLSHRGRGRAIAGGTLGLIGELHGGLRLRAREHRERNAESERAAHQFHLSSSRLSSASSRRAIESQNTRIVTSSRNASSALMRETSDADA